jgi:hypothetical protein
MSRALFQKGRSGNPAGRPRGSKDSVPRAVRTCIREVCQDIATDDPALVRQAFEQGLRSRPPKSFQYLQLYAHYTSGKPKEQIEISTPEPITVVNRFHGVTPAGEPLALPPAPTPGEPDAHD